MAALTSPTPALARGLDKFFKFLKRAPKASLSGQRCSIATVARGADGRTSYRTNGGTKALHLRSFHILTIRETSSNAHAFEVLIV